jgi:DNA invertase Pin-like site-specific DNA recombinase
METSPRGEVLPFSHHIEVATLPLAEADLLRRIAAKRKALCACVRLEPHSVLPLTVMISPDSMTDGDLKTMARKEIIKAVAYFRTSSMTNVGEDKDTLKRQREAVTRFANGGGYEIVEEFCDDAVKGSDPVDQRPGFAAMLDRIAGNGVRTIIVETASRFARDLIVQETGFRFLQGLGVTLIAADSPDAFLDDTPTAVLIRQVLGAVSQFEKAAIVAKLRGARERKKRATGKKVEGRKSHAEERPEVVALAKLLARKRPKGGQLSLRAVAAALAAQGHVNERGKPFHPQSVAAMLGRSS